MRKMLSSAIGGLGLLLAAVPAFPHHSFASEFDISQPVTLTGTLTRMEWVNPHGWIYVDVKGPDGTVVNWAIEAGSANSLLRNGLRKENFPVGTEVVIEGYRAKNGRAAANGRTVKLTDGRSFFMGTGNSPNDGPEEKSIRR